MVVGGQIFSLLKLVLSIRNYCSAGGLCVPLPGFVLGLGGLPFSSSESQLLAGSGEMTPLSLEW